MNILNNIRKVNYFKKIYRGNLVSDYVEVKKLQVLPKLRALVLLGKLNDKFVDKQEMI